MALPGTPKHGSPSSQGDRENDPPIGSNACKDLTKERNLDLQPVSPFSSGEGLPYAPEGWPSPGDVWGWKTLSKTNKAGYFVDRLLYLPKCLQRSPHNRRSLRTKPEVERFIESKFPNMAIHAFFDLFSWQIPSTGKTPTKAVESSPITPLGKSLEIGDDATEEISTQKKLKRKTKILSQPTRKSSRLRHVRPRLSANQDANTIINLNGITEFCNLNEEARIDATENLEGILDSEEGTDMQIASEEGTDMQTATTAKPYPTAGEKYPIETVFENFSDYLDNLEDMIVMPRVETSPVDVASTTTSDDKMIECCKKKLSSLLAADISSLVSCDNVVEVATLASQIRKDPTLSVDQLTQLKLVEQIPSACEAVLDAKGDIEEADKFLGDLEAKKQKVLGLKNEYKDKVVDIESEMAKSSSAIQKIDDQIRPLESKRKEISSALETMQESKANVVNSVVTLVGEIQAGLSEKSKWELKKANSAKRVADIQEKFSTLKGLTF